jgi:hypothetical protein
MPGPFERRSRPNGSCEGLYSQPSRSQLRSAAVAADVREPARKAPGKKDPALCKAAHWKGPHKPGLIKNEPLFRREFPCRWDASWTADGPEWFCYHEERCARCGKVLRSRVGREECPEFRPITDDELAAIEAEIKRHEGIRAARAARKPVITGPQGYRKRKSA